MRGKIKRKTIQAIALAAMSNVSLVAHGQVSGSWISPAGGIWIVPSNWSSNPLYPDTGGDATIDANGGTITLDSPITLSSLHFNGVLPVIIKGTSVITLDGPAVLESIRSTIYEEQLFSRPGNWRPFPGDGHIIDAPIAGTSGLVKTGAGIVSLHGSSGFTGGVTILDGQLNVLANWGLGDVSGNVMLNGGKLRTDNFEHTRQIIIGPNGGHLQGRATTHSGPITGSGSLTMSGTNTLTGNNSFNGTLTVLGQGTSDLILQGNGALSSNLIRLIGAKMQLDNSNIANNNRIADGAELRLISSSHLDVIGNQATPINEHVGTVTLAGGNGTLSTDSLSLLTIGHLKREHRAIVNLSGNISIANASSLLFGSGGAAGSQNQSILPFAIGPNGGMVTHDQNGIRELLSSEYFTIHPGTPISGLSPDTNVRLSGVRIDEPIQVNSVVGDNHFYGTGTITVNSGLVVGQYSTLR